MRTRKQALEYGSSKRIYEAEGIKVTDGRVDLGVYQWIENRGG